VARLSFIYNTIRTPSDFVNIVCGGGIKEGTIVEIWGSPTGGKSAFSYQTAANYLEDHPEAQVWIIDPETSTDYIRLKFTFRLPVDSDRVQVFPAPTLEAGFAVITKACTLIEEWKTAPTEEEGKKLSKKEFAKLCEKWSIDPESDDRVIELLQIRMKGGLRSGPCPRILLIYDTIAVSRPALEVEAYLQALGETNLEDSSDINPKANPGGLNLKPRVMERCLALACGQMYGLPVTLILLNQARMGGFGSFQGPSLTSSGGFALKHYIHYRIAIEPVKKIFDEVRHANVGTQSKLAISKSKFCPTSNDVRIVIDDTVGGKIIPSEEAALLCQKIGILESSGAWWRFTDEPNPKSLRWVDIAGNDEMRRVCYEKLVHHFRRNYMTIDLLYEHLGIETGKLTEEEKKSAWGVQMVYSEPLMDRKEIDVSVVRKPITKLVTDTEAAGS
jgi:RecA/RadA recombinase